MNKHRTGLTDPVHLAVPVDGDGLPANDILDGDVVADDGGDLVNAENFTWNTDEATTQTEFAAAFRGLCVGNSKEGSTDYRALEVPVLQDGNVEFDCESDDYAFGDFIGPAKGSGNNLTNTMQIVSTKAKAIAVVQKTTESNATRVLARLINTVPKK